jgi:sulfotransferase family protein
MSMMRRVSRLFFTPIKQHLSSLFVSEAEWKSWSSAWRFFFILSLGRSGTSFLAGLLDRAADTYVFHEPAVEDFYAYWSVFHHPERARRYIEGFRAKEIFLRMHRVPAGTYGEVNSLLRRHVNAIRSAIPSASLIHLVRDGRDVVRSIVSRNTFTFKDPLSIGLYPGDSDPWRESWPDMDRFARICWYWQEENRQLRTTIGDPVQLERILISYEYFSGKILEPCGILLDRRDWEIATAVPRNTTREFSMPTWDQWSAAQRRTFTEICGDEMEKCGYVS